MSDLPSYDQLLVQARAVAAEVRTAEAPERPLPNLRLRNAAIIAGGAAVIFGYGYHAWWGDGFRSEFRGQSEGWFDRDTAFSGVDKLGHAFTGYAGVRGMSALFQAAGNSPETSRRLAALSTWGVMSAMEILDGFSHDYRFSHEDFIANTVGVALGYWLDACPQWDDVLDFRLAYRPSKLSNFDPAGDYAGQRFFLVAKADGVPGLRDVPGLRYLELAVGYGDPGADIPDEWNLHDWAQRRREVFVGISLNLSRVLADAFYGGARSTTRTQRVAEGAFEVIQLPVMAYRAWDIDR